jgi:hypothetical protein
MTRQADFSTSRTFDGDMPLPSTKEFKHSTANRANAKSTLCAQTADQQGEQRNVRIFADL